MELVNPVKILDELLAFHFALMPFGIDRNQSLRPPSYK